VDDSGKIFVGRFLRPEQIEEWVYGQTISRHVWGICTHHTWSPDQKTWRGIRSLESVFVYYSSALKWPRGIGPHFFVGPEFSYGSTVGVFVATHPQRQGIHCAGCNAGSIGVEHVWNGDRAPFPPEYLHVSSILYRALGDKLGIPMERSFNREPGLFFHRDHATKSCPGSAVKHAEFIAAIRYPPLMEAAGEEDDMTPEQDERLTKVEKSLRASSFREAILIAISCGDWDRAEALDAQAQAQGFVTGFSRPT
jgi:hypothetical protein